MQNKTLIYIGVYGLLVTQTACTPLTQHSIFGSQEGGYVSINADAAGMQALSDWNTGLVNESRTPEGTKGSHYQLREAQEQAKTQRFTIKWGLANKGGK